MPRHGRVRAAKRRAHLRGEDPGKRTTTTATGDVRPKRPFWHVLGKVGRVAAAVGTGGASEAAIAAARAVKDGKVRPGRAALAIATGGASEVARLGAKLLTKRGHRGDGPNPHPFFHGPPRLRPDRAQLVRKDVGRHIAGLHGPVLVDPRRKAFIHPAPGELHHRRKAAFRIRHGLPVDRS